MRSPFCLSLSLAAAFLTSCVSTGKFNAVQQQAIRNDSLYNSSRNDLKACRDSAADILHQRQVMQEQMDNLNKQLTEAFANNKQLLGQIKDLSLITNAQAESIKSSIDNIGKKDDYMQNLQKALSSRDSAGMALLLYLKGTVGNLSDQDFHIQLEHGGVNIDISDKLLFNGSTYDLTDNAKIVLKKVALALTDQPDFRFMVEGHTDSLPYAQAPLLDNWDLSVKRATAIVRLFQDQFHIAPSRMTAAGQGETIPVAPNDTPEGQQANRRTRILIFPLAERLNKVLERKG